MTPSRPVVYVASVGGATRRLELQAIGEGRYHVRLDGGPTREVDARWLGGGNLSVLLDGQSYDLELEVAGDTELSGDYNVLVRGDVIALSVQNERRLRARTASKLEGGGGPQTVRSPMPGKLVKILVAVGDAVVEGQPVAIVEAMKMENEIRAPSAGTVTKVMVEAEQAVEGQAPLLAIE